jgi:MFS family permease
MAPLVVGSIVYAAVSYPAGAAADRGHGPKLLAAGLLALIASDVALANANGIVVLFAGAALWGLHMGLTQGLLAALVAASVPADLRGTAFGVFNLVCGIALLIASVAGWLWDARSGAECRRYVHRIAALGLLRYVCRATMLRGRMAIVCKDAVPAPTKSHRL